MTTVAETEGIGVTYAGTASGVTMTLSRVGSIFSPVIGNSIATTNPSLAFIFWAVLASIGTVIFGFIKETGWRAKSSQTAN